MFIFSILIYKNVRHDEIIFPQEKIEYKIANKHLLEPILIASFISGLDYHLIDAVISVESEGDSLAQSPTKVRGPMQVTKKTATIYGLSPYNTYENILAGSLYLRDMISEFRDTSLALAAYNKGPTYVKNNIELITFSYSKKVNKFYEANKAI